MDYPIRGNLVRRGGEEKEQLCRGISVIVPAHITFLPADSQRTLVQPDHATYVSRDQRETRLVHEPPSAPVNQIQVIPHNTNTGAETTHNDVDVCFLLQHKILKFKIAVSFYKVL